MIISMRYDYFAYFIRGLINSSPLLIQLASALCCSESAYDFPRNFGAYLHATESSKLSKFQVLNKLEITKIILFIYDNTTVRMSQAFLPFKSFRPDSTNTKQIKPKSTMKKFHVLRRLKSKSKRPSAYEKNNFDL